MDRSAISYELQLGPMLMATVFTNFLNGIFAMQLFHYCRHYAASDRLFFKILVAATTCIEIANMVVSIDLTYYSLVRNYANPMALLISPHSTLLMPLLNGLVGFCVHVFFTWRVMVMTKTRAGKVAAALIFTMALVTLSAATATTICYYVYRAAEAGRVPLSLWLSASAACDLLITATIVSLLWSAKWMAEFSPSKGILNLLIAHTIENGLITTLCATADQIAFFTLPPLNLTCLCLTSVLGRLYAIVLLASLNGRDRARKQFRGPNTKFSSSFNTDTRNTDSMQLSAFETGLPKTNQTQATAASFPVIAVSTDIEERGDDEKFKNHKMYS